MYSQSHNVNLLTSMTNYNENLIRAKILLNGPDLQEKKGSVGMDGITTKGDIEVKDSSIGFGAGSSLVFGSNPNIISGNCPFCNKKIEIDKRQLTGHSMIKCPNRMSGREMLFSIN